MNYSSNSNTNNLNSAEIVEGVSVTLEPAPFWKRFLAYLIDLGLVILVFYLLLFVFVFLAIALIGVVTTLPNLTDFVGWTGIILVVVGLLITLSVMDGYFILLEAKTGRTLGKKLFGLSVVTLSGAPPSTSQAVIRGLFRYIDCLLVLPGLLSVLLSEKGRRIGDLAAGTLVVHSVHQERDSQYLYMPQERYHYLSSLLGQQEIPADLVREYLKFAFPYYLHNRGQEQADNWAEKIDQYLLENNQISADDRLRYFAERCHQLLLNRR